MDYRWIRDLVFKGVFGSEPNKKVLAAFLNKLLGYEEDHQIVDLTILNPFVMSDVDIFDKFVILDVTAKDILGNVYHIEVQIAPDKDIYSRLVSTQLSKGDSYSKLPKIITIAIIGDFIMFDHTEDIHSVFRYMEVNKQFPLGDPGEIHVVELKKFRIVKPGDAKTSLERWLYLLKYGDYLAEQKELPENFKKEKEMEQAMDTYIGLVSDDKFRAHLEAKEKFEWDQASRFKNALMEGEQIGIAKGKQIGITEGKQIGIIEGEQTAKTKLAKNMLRDGVDIATVAKYTGLSEVFLKGLVE